jgi:hypothetical protein
MTTRRTNRTTVEIQAVPMAAIMAEIGGHEQRAPYRTETYATECATTQHEMPAIRETRPASKWSLRSLTRLLSDVLAVQS